MSKEKVVYEEPDPLAKKKKRLEQYRKARERRKQRFKEDPDFYEQEKKKARERFQRYMQDPANRAYHNERCKEYHRKKRAKKDIDE